MIESQVASYRVSEIPVPDQSLYMEIALLFNMETNSKTFCQHLSLSLFPCYKFYSTGNGNAKAKAELKDAYE